MKIAILSILCGIFLIWSFTITRFIPESFFGQKSKRPSKKSLSLIWILSAVSYILLFIYFLSPSIEHIDHIINLDPPPNPLITIPFLLTVLLQSIILLFFKSMIISLTALLPQFILCIIVNEFLCIDNTII